MSEAERQLKNRQKHYQKLVEHNRPRPPILRNLVVAFVVGGLISVVGQFVLNFIMTRGLTEDQAVGPTLAVMIFLGAFTTSIGIYDALGEFAGAGAAVPITGFSNTIVSAAMDFKREGYVLGLGAKMFIIAGPVLVYGILTGVVIGTVGMIARLAR